MLLMVGDGCKKWEVDVDRIKFPFEPGPALASIGGGLAAGHSCGAACHARDGFFAMVP